MPTVVFQHGLRFTTTCADHRHDATFEVSFLILAGLLFLEIPSEVCNFTWSLQITLLLHPLRKARSPLCQHVSLSLTPRATHPCIPCILPNLSPLRNLHFSVTWTAIFLEWSRPPTFLDLDPYPLSTPLPRSLRKSPPYWMPVHSSLNTYFIVKSFLHSGLQIIQNCLSGLFLL